MRHHRWLRDGPTPGPGARTEAVYARTATDDDDGTACRGQVREVLETLGNPPVPTVYADPRKSGLDADRPALRHLLVEIRRGRLQRVAVRDVNRLARDATLLETILGKLRAADVELVITGDRTDNA